MVGLVIYIASFVIVIAIVASITTFFNSNVRGMNGLGNVGADYNKFNLYLLEYTKNGYDILRCSESPSASEQFITFVKNGKMDTFAKVGDGLYFNKVKLCEKVDEFKVEKTKAENGKDLIKTYLEIDGTVYTTDYVVEEEDFLTLSQKLGYATNGIVLHYDGIRNTSSRHNKNSAIWEDLSRNGNDGTLLGGTWENNCLNCNGTGDMVSPIPVQEKPNDNLTIEMVFRIDSMNSRPGLLQSVNGWSSFNSHLWDENTFYIGVTAAESSRITPANMGNFKIEKGKIYDMVYTYNGSSKEAKLYMNGNNIATKTYTTSPADSEYFKISAGNKKVYNLMIYKSVLTSAQVQQNYQIDKARFGIN